VISLTVLLAMGYAAWWLVWSTPVNTHGGFGIAADDVEPDEPRTVAVGPLCLDGAANAMIEKVTVDPAQLTVADFGVRHSPRSPAPSFIARKGTLESTGPGWGRSFDDQCSAGDYAEIAVEFRRGVLGPAHTEVVNVHWSAGVRSGVLTLPVQVTLCTVDQVDEHCPEDPPPFDGER
jgi:hypothetical protein